MSSAEELLTWTLALARQDPDPQVTPRLRRALSPSGSPVVAGPAGPRPGLASESLLDVAWNAGLGSEGMRRLLEVAGAGEGDAGGAERLWTAPGS